MIAMKLVSLGVLLVYGCTVEGYAIPGELYSSMIHVADLFQFDAKIAEVLPYLPSYIPEVKEYDRSHACLFKDTNRLGEGDLLSTSITGNPLHLYSVIKRLVLYWPAISRSMIVINNTEYNCDDKHPNCEWWSQWSECEKNPTFMLVNCQLSCGLCGRTGNLLDTLASVRQFEMMTVLPSLRDLRGAALALARLQQMYRIPIPALAGGRIANISTCVRLSTYDCIRIANESYFEGDYASAWQWYNYAFGATLDPDGKGHIRDLMYLVKKQHDETYQQFIPQYFPRKLSEMEQQTPWDTKYSQLCRGFKLMKPEEESNLKCHISPRGSPYLILQPVKYEHLHFDPEMYLFYDVVSSPEILIIQNAAKQYLLRSKMLSPKVPEEWRVSHTAWLNNKTHSSLQNIATRIAAITGLHVFEGSQDYMAGETLQVLSYGIGGHYRYHHDVFYKCHPENQWYEVGKQYDHYPSGDRLATWMFYLSHVEAGGRTAFPQAGISVAPVKGAAVFWYSIKKNGYGNQRSEHGGCPVMLGHKWVANKWIRENINFLRRPCALQPEE
ncbi:Prolyl 4-hydroxylase subunit alpha-3 [Halocaridina rubra]|uniref:Prolyl 4-hydroxylase subunit alpha-3 n=1 Tax=Halocaridina rubra TaxID=373956 RepID=A0AAN9AH45_HALRR